MNWLSEILDRFLPRKPNGLVLEGDDAWLLDSDADEQNGRDLAPLLSHAVDLFPPGAVLYLEGTSLSPDIRAILDEHRATETSPITRATRWPKPQVFHIPLTADLADPLGTLCRDRPSRELCDHLHVYREDQLLLQGFDAGWEPLLVSATIPESTIAAFCEQTGFTCKRESTV